MAVLDHDNKCVTVYPGSLRCAVTANWCIIHNDTASIIGYLCDSHKKEFQNWGPISLLSFVPIGGER